MDFPIYRHAFDLDQEIVPQKRRKCYSRLTVLASVEFRAATHLYI